MSSSLNILLAARSVEIPAGNLHLKGDLALPKIASGIVIFAHGSGSGRHSPRNQFVARSLQNAGLATLLLDLLSESEAEERSKVFDIELLASRVMAAIDWAGQNADTAHLLTGLFGASTGAAAALVAAAKDPQAIEALVSRGGRPDLAGSYLPHVLGSTLLIVGGEDDACIPLNEWAYTQLTCEKRMAVVPGATHLFEEPGTLEDVSRLACEWFSSHLVPRHSGAGRH